MKKIALVLVLALVCSVGVIGAANEFDLLTKEAETPDIKIAVISDTHVLSEEQIGDATSPDFLWYNSVSQKMLYISEAILKTTADMLIASDVEFVFVTGDLTDDGGEASHRAVARELKRIEDAGKTVYVINGNHDVNRNGKYYASGVGVVGENRVTPELFKEIYNDFGYEGALTYDDETLSYAVDLNDEYRLIAIDPCNYYFTGAELQDWGIPNVTDELLAWTEEQLQRCVADGKKPMGIMHFPVGEHMGEFIRAVAIKNTRVNRDTEVADLLTRYGMELLFTGHMHQVDILEVKTKYGTLTDAETNCLSNYPMAIRFAYGYKDRIELSVTNLDYLDEKYYPSYLSAEDRAEISADFVKFAADYVADDIYEKFLPSVNRTMLLSVLAAFGVDKTNPDATVLADELVEFIVDLVHMPVYAKDAAVGEDSMESIAKACGVNDFPQSDCKTMLDIVMNTLRKHYAGDEDSTQDSPKGRLVKYTVYTLLYAIDDFGTFDRIKELNPECKDIDLLPIMDTLFQTGEIDLVETNLVGNLAGSLTFVQTIAVLKPLTTADGEGIMQALYALRKARYAGITLEDYISFERNTILFEKLLFHTAGYGILVDDSVPDNYYVMPKITPENNSTDIGDTQND